MSVWTDQRLGQSLSLKWRAGACAHDPVMKAFTNMIADQRSN